jgi:hypothetical protein
MNVVKNLHNQAAKRLEMNAMIFIIHISVVCVLF